MKKIAIQGTLGSYHDIAAHKYFEGEEIELICCANFEDVFTSIRKDSQVIGMLAIENTIAGSLLHNNELLRQSGTQITNKASMVFTLPHTEGSLSQVLSILSFYNINLTKIQSLPIIGREWEYQFYVDVAFNDYLRYKQSIAAITPLTKELKTLGEYAEGKSNV